MGLLGRVRERVANGALPTSRPPIVARTTGAGALCNVCDETIRAPEKQIGFESAAVGMMRFHVGCYALWVAVLVDRGWINPA
jgi:hypothetical protein